MKTRKPQGHGRTDNGDLFVTYLKYHRLLAGWTQEIAAKRCRMTQPYYSQIETGLRRPSGRQIDNIANGFSRPKVEVLSRLHNVDPKEFEIPGKGAA